MLNKDIMSFYHTEPSRGHEKIKMFYAVWCGPGFISTEKNYDLKDGVSKPTHYVFYVT